MYLEEERMGGRDSLQILEKTEKTNITSHKRTIFDPD